STTTTSHDAPSGGSTANRLASAASSSTARLYVQMRTDTIIGVPHPRDPAGPHSRLPQKLATEERFGIARWRPALYPAEAHQTQKHFLVEPGLASLTGVHPRQQGGLAPRACRRHVRVYVRRREIAVPFRDLVLHDQTPTECIPCRVGQHPV